MPSPDTQHTDMLLRFRPAGMPGSRAPVASAAPQGHWAAWLTGSCLPVDQDGVEPSANSVAVANLLRAACYSGNMEWVEKAGQILAAFSERLLKIPVALPEMARATVAFHRTLKQVGSLPSGSVWSETPLLLPQHVLFCPRIEAPPHPELSSLAYRESDCPGWRDGCSTAEARVCGCRPVPWGREGILCLAAPVEILGCIGLEDVPCILQRAPREGGERAVPFGAPSCLAMASPFGNSWWQFCCVYPQESDEAGTVSD